MRRNRFSVLASLLIFCFGSLSQAQSYKFSTLYTFKNNGKDPASPAFLILDSAGNIYGTSLSGGKHGQGTVFEITPKGVLTVLHNFDGTDGGQPNSLARDGRQGNLYGTTWVPGSGTVFEMAKGKAGTYTLSTLYSASTARPQSVTLDSHGNVYGTDTGCYCLFEIPAGGQWTDLYDTGGQPTYVVGNVVINKAGIPFFSVDYEGISGYGEVMELNLNVFRAPGGYGVTYLRQDAAGNIYGIADGGGDGFDNYGLVFKISPMTGVLSSLYEFTNGTDGTTPTGPFSLDSAGNVYGTATGGTLGFGLVFKVTPQGKESVLYNFSSSTGYGLVMDAAGNLYGLTSQGDSSSVYKLTLKK